MFCEKRKRSEEEDTSSSSRDSSSSPMSFATGAITSHHIPQGVNSRTLKRWRSNKPNEDVVRDYTMQKLYAGQQQAQPHTPAPVEQEHAYVQPAVARNLYLPSAPYTQAPTPRAKSPHPFFTMFAQQQTQHLRAPTPMVQQCYTCDDCDRQLPASWDDEDGCGYMCGGMGCEKKVCEGCSIGGVEMGMQRRCLDCAMHCA